MSAALTHLTLQFPDPDAQQLEFMSKSPAARGPQGEMTPKAQDRLHMQLIQPPFPNDSCIFSHNSVAAYCIEVYSPPTHAFSAWPQSGFGAGLMGH